MKKSFFIIIATALIFTSIVPSVASTAQAKTTMIAAEPICCIMTT